MKKILSALVFLSVTAITAQVPIEIYQQFLGKYDFTMIGNTMNELPNGANTYCDMLTESSADLTLAPTQTVVAAYLYWAGSGSLAQGDLDILLNGQPVTVDRTFQTFMGVGANNRPFYGGFSDVTAQVLATGNGTYTVSEFDLSGIISPSTYCSNGTNFGGWSILVVYEDPAVTDNLVNVYDGFRKVDTAEPVVNITLTNLNVLHVVGNKIGFLAWEGDSNIAVQETVRINGEILSNPPLNPATNVFNGTNSFTGSNTLYNMDIDYFDINDYTNIGDNTLTVQLQTGQDVVLINNMVVVLNTQVPDATIMMNAEFGSCDDRDIAVDYTVSNLISTDILPAGTPIAFYGDGVLVGSSATVNDIAIGGSESGSIVLSIPDTVPNIFTLTARVDDDGAGNSTVIEFSEENNEDHTEITLGTTPSLFPADNLILCDSNDNGQETFDLTVPGNQILNAQLGVIIRYYENETDALSGAANNIANPDAYANTASPQTIYVRLEDPVGCAIVSEFSIEITPPSPLPHEIPDMGNCVEGSDDTGVLTDLTSQETFILNGENPLDYSITYHLSENTARSGINPIANPAAYPNVSNPQTIWVRMVSNDDNCVEFGSFEIIYHLNPVVHATILESCSLDGPGTFFLPEANPFVVDDTTGLQFTYHLTLEDANNDTDPLPSNYTPASEFETVYVRVTDGFGCYAVIGVTLDTVVNVASLTDVYAVCDDPRMINDETAEFDLTTYDTPIRNALSLPGAEVSYYLSEDEAASGINPIPNPAEFINTSNPQTIYARAANPEGGCGGIADFQIEVLPVPEFTLPDFLAFCDYDNPNYEFNESFQTYVWQNASGEVVSNSPFVEFDQEGIYTLEVTNAVNDCPAIREVEVIFDHQPVITNIEVDGHTVSVYPTGGLGPYQYSYNSGLTWHDYFILEEVPSGIHFMIVKSLYGCISEAKMFGVLNIPNVITPNGDGYNDYWEIRALEMYPDSHVKIFDRYGKIFVDRKMGENFRWDGHYLGRPLPSGDYWYIITVEGHQISGHLTIRNR